MKAASAFLLLLAGAPLLSACSSSDTNQGQSPAGANIGPYPSGPYGNAEGDTLTNLKLQGYVNDKGDAISNTLPFVSSYSLEKVRASGAKYALVHVSEFF